MHNAGLNNARFQYTSMLFLSRWVRYCFHASILFFSAVLVIHHFAVHFATSEIKASTLNKAFLGYGILVNDNALVQYSYFVDVNHMHVISH